MTRGTTNRCAAARAETSSYPHRNRADGRLPRFAMMIGGVHAASRQMRDVAVCFPGPGCGCEHKRSRSRRHDGGNHVPSVFAVDPKVAVQSENWAVIVLFSHA